jgi:thioredoxin-like negative regulator of GroEL
VKGQSYVDQARAVSAADHEQKIALAQTMIQAGKLQDAENLLDQIDAQSLSPEAREKLDAAREKLDAAKSR